MKYNDITNIKDNIVILYKYKYKNILFCFFIANENLYTDKKYIQYTFQIYDKYMIGYDRPLKNLNEILYMQYLDKKNMNIKNISSPELMTLTSNKLIYTEYLIHNKLLYNTKVKYNKIPNKFKDYVIKLPYSSNEKCIFYNEIKKKNCIENQGYIIQKYNKSLKEFELKCNVVNGNIFYIMIRIGKSFSICCDNKFKSGVEFIDKILYKFKNEVMILCKKGFLLMNKLVYLYKERSKLESQLLYKILKKNKNIVSINNINKILTNNLNKNINIDSIITSPCINEKINILTEINNIFKNNIKKEIDTLIKIIKAPYKSYEKIKKYNNHIYDHYMRIDISIPDNINFDRCYINEIEPFASGKGNSDIVDKCIINELQYPNDKILKKIISTNIKNYNNDFKKII